MAPPVGIPAAPLGSGLSATIASVVINSPADLMIMKESDIMGVVDHAAANKKAA
jgi:hypothetical protein